MSGAKGTEEVVYDNPMFNSSEMQKQNEPEALSDSAGTTDASSNEVLAKFHEYGSEEQTQGYGIVSFPERHKQAPFLCLSKDDRPKDALEFVTTMLRLQRPDFPEPSLVLSVTGGARSFDLSPHLEEILRKGLGNVVRKTNAWVVSGGTHTGVMKVTGSIMNAYYSGQRHIISPTIGIATLGVLSHYEELCKANGKPIEHTMKNITETPDLDPNHTHYLLIDEDTSHFGGEIRFRARFEQAICKKYHASAVTVVIQGGPNTLQTALDSVKQDTPLVIVNHSGGAADVLAYAYNFLHGASSQYSGYTAQGLRQQLEEKVKEDWEHNRSYRILFLDALNSVLDRSKIHIFDLHRGGTEELESQIFKAVSTAETDRQAKLKIALTFDRIEEAKALVDEEPLQGEDNPAELLKQALIQDRPEFVRLFLSAGAKATNLKPKNGAGHPGQPKDSKSHREVFYSALEELYEVLLSHSHC